MAEPATEQKSEPGEVQKHPLVVVREQLESRLEEFKAALPSHISPQRFQRTALTAIQLNPELAVADRRTLLNSLLRCASDGLLPDGRESALVIFNDNNPKSRTFRKQVVVYMPMVAGLLTRFRNSGQFKSIGAEVVREGEDFKFWIDEKGEHLHHEPGDGTGKIVKVYARAETKDGGTMIRVMSAADVEKRRAVSRAKDGPMWRDWWDEAAIKTVLRNLHKRLPSSSDDLDRLVQRDAELYGPGPLELPDARGERVTGVLSALDAFGDRAPAADDEQTADQPQEAAQQQDGEAHGEETQNAGQTGEAEKSPVEVARARGVQARRDGLQRKALPTEYRTAERTAEAIAWREGWDSSNDN